MKIRHSLVLLFSLLITNLWAQDRTTVSATNSDISDNLDLEAVASIFADSENLEDFERRLNNPELQISNLDLNEDNQVDYLRVIEHNEGGFHLITIQAILGRDLFQDVATIEVEKDSRGKIRVQVVGDVYMYGDNYIIEPVFVYRPRIYSWFWGSFYTPWHSPYYWSYYPGFFKPWRVYTIFDYHRIVYKHKNVKHKYYYQNSRLKSPIYYSKRESRKAYFDKYPNRVFVKRNNGFKNSREIVITRKNANDNKRESNARNNNGRSSSNSGNNSSWNSKDANKDQVKYRETNIRTNNTNNNGEKNKGRKDNKSKDKSNERSRNSNTKTETKYKEVEKTKTVNTSSTSGSTSRGRQASESNSSKRSER